MCLSLCSERAALLTHLSSCNFVPGPSFRERFLLVFCLMGVTLCESCHSRVPQTGGLNSRSESAHRSGDQKAESKVAGGLVLSEGSAGGSVPGLSPGLAGGCAFPVSLGRQPSVHVWMP